MSLSGVMRNMASEGNLRGLRKGSVRLGADPLPPDARDLIRSPAGRDVNPLPKIVKEPSSISPMPKKRSAKGILVSLRDAALPPDVKEEVAARAREQVRDRSASVTKSTSSSEQQARRENAVRGRAPPVYKIDTLPADTRDSVRSPAGREVASRPRRHAPTIDGDDSASVYSRYHAGRRRATISSSASTTSTNSLGSSSDMAPFHHTARTISESGSRLKLGLLSPTKNVRKMMSWKHSPRMSTDSTQPISSAIFSGSEVSIISSHSSEGAHGQPAVLVVKTDFLPPLSFELTPSPPPTDDSFDQPSITSPRTPKTAAEVERLTHRFRATFAIPEGVTPDTAGAHTFEPLPEEPFLEATYDQDRGEYPVWEEGDRDDASTYEVAQYHQDLFYIDDEYHP